MVNVYAFDVDDTLEVSNGPISIQQLVKLKMGGHVIGLCGNWSLFLWEVRGWQNLISFIGAIGISKAEFLRNLKTFMPRMDRYVMVGNEADKSEAETADWEFVYEKDFKEGLDDAET